MEHASIEDRLMKLEGKSLALTAALSMVIQTQPETLQVLKTAHLHQSLLASLLQKGFPAPLALSAQETVAALIAPADPSTE